MHVKDNMNMNVQTGACGNGDDDDDEEGEPADMEGSSEFLFIFQNTHLLTSMFDFITGICISEYEESGLLETDDVRICAQRKLFNIRIFFCRIIL